MFSDLKAIRLIKNAILVTSTSAFLIFITFAPDTVEVYDSHDKVLTGFPKSELLIDSFLLFNFIMIPAYIAMSILEMKVSKKKINGFKKTGRFKR